MAKCSWCGKDMCDDSTISCVKNIEVEFPDSLILSAVPYLPDDPESRCHDCNVKAGGYHHPGCDMERCPKCGGQLISCGCLDADDEDADSEEENILIPEDLVRVLECTDQLFQYVKDDREQMQQKVFDFGYEVLHLHLTRATIDRIIDDELLGLIKPS